MSIARQIGIRASSAKVPVVINVAKKSLIRGKAISRKNRTRKGSSFLMGGGKQRNGFSEENL